MNTKFKNLLVQYQGGGYDGCFWEWNYFCYDSRGVFHNIAASGRNGIKAEAEAIECLNRTKDRFGFSRQEFHSYRLTVKKDIKAFQADCAPRHVANVVSKVNEIYQASVMYWICQECGGKQFNGEMYHDGYRGNGGIGVVQTGMLCMDCYSAGSCNKCDAYTDPDKIQLVIDSQGNEFYACEYCAEDLITVPQGISVVRAYSPEDANRVAIHLLKPDRADFERAFEQADRDNFAVVMIHNDSTWPKTLKGKV